MLLVMGPTPRSWGTRRPATAPRETAGRRPASTGPSSVRRPVPARWSTA